MTNVQIKLGEDGNIKPAHFKAIKYSLDSKDIKREDWNLKLAIESDLIAAETGEVNIKGMVTENSGAEKPFSSTIKNVKIKYTLATTTNEKH